MNKSDSAKNANNIWHGRLAHGNSNAITAMLSSKWYRMTFADKPYTLDCSTCVPTKHIEHSYKRGLIMFSRMATLHADSCGPIGKPIFLAMSIAEQRYLSSIFLKHKGNLENNFLKYIRRLEPHTEIIVRRVHTDNAPEFLLKRRAL